MTEPCNCGKPLYDEGSDYEGDEGYCDHWAIEDVPAAALKKGDLYAVQGDLPLEVAWRYVVRDADPVTGEHWSLNAQGHEHRSKPFKPTQLFRVLRFGRLGRQTLEPSP